MANDKGNGHDGPSFEDQMDRVKIGEEATAEWSDALCRIADASEHTAMASAFVQLSSVGLELGGPVLGIKHRKDCPVCQMMRDAHPASALIKPTERL